MSRANPSKRKNLPRAFTVKHNGRTSQLLSPISVFKAINPVSSTPHNVHPTTALWDTGATGSVIDEDIVKDLNLVPVGTKDVTTASATQTKNTYMVSFHLPNGVTVNGLTVTECPSFVGGVNFQVIIGMDVITLGDFAITSLKGETCFSFCLPSFETVDYVKKINSIQYKGVKPRSPCPCGKKDSRGRAVLFKDCHGK